MAQPRLSLVIVNWNARERLRGCLRSLASQSDTDFELIVVDNGSRDGSQAMVAREHPFARLVRLPRNEGFARGCNEGLARATGEWILTLNNDTEVPPDLIARLRRAARGAAEDVGMVQPRVVFQDARERINSTGVVVYKDGSAMDRDFGRPAGARGEADEVLCVTAGAGLYRQTMLEATRLPGGYFDPSFFMYFEDVDLGWRCRLAGWRAEYAPDAVVYHAFQGTSRRHGRHFVTTQCMQNRVRTLIKNGSWKLVLRSLPRTASDLLWLLQHAGGTALAAWVEAVGSALGQRRAVTRLSRGSRRAVERRWLEARP